MHVLLAHNDYARFSGEEAAVENVASTLLSQGHEVTWFRRSSAAIGDSVVRKAGALWSGLYSVRSRREIADLIGSGGFDVAQVQNLYPFLSASVLPVLHNRGIPVVMRCPNYRLFCPTGLHLHEGRVCEKCLRMAREWHCVKNNCESDLFKSIGYAARNAFGRLSGLIRKNVDVFVVLSEFQRQRFVAGGIPAEKIEILPNPADARQVQPVDLDGGFVSFVGRVSEEKGIREFLEAAHRLPNLVFRVAGSIDDRLRLDHVPPNVQFVGFLKDKALEDFFTESRILVFPSKWFEGFPNTIAMAMGFGKPVVAARMGAIPEIVDDGRTGLLASPGDGEELAHKIAYLWERPVQCAEMGRAGWEKARREYSRQRFYERLMAIYAKARVLSAA